MRVMVADDEELVREYVTLVVTLAGHEIVTAASGFEAIRRAKCDQPDLILLDGIMPEMQGLEVARYLRGQKLARQPYLIAMSARPATEAEAGRMKTKYGIDDYLEKPLTPIAILSAIDRCLARRIETPESTRADWRRRQPH